MLVNFLIQFSVLFSWCARTLGTGHTVHTSFTIFFCSRELLTRLLCFIRFVYSIGCTLWRTKKIPLRKLWFRFSFFFFCKTQSLFYSLIECHAMRRIKTKEKKIRMCVSKFVYLQSDRQLKLVNAEFMFFSVFTIFFFTFALAQ